MKQYTDMLGKDKNSPEIQLQTERDVELFRLPALMHSSLFINNMYVTLLSSTCFEH